MPTTSVVSVWFQTVSVLFWRVLARAYYSCCFSVVFRLFQSCFGEYLHVPTTPVVSSL